ncbi:permease-like cell division protein FtsX [Micromonospora sp. SL4-19]|uniref:permease-like cell division protein FtsX n=1 Tax=Micromonospora sp. SL4-19 TaxID=3399129 RepID=UPI003A4D3B1F
MRRIGPVLVLVLLVALSACTSEPKESGHTTLTLTVLLDKDVTAEQKRAAEQRLRSMPSVEGVAFETRKQAYERQKELLKDAPDLLAKVKPEYLPESFRATVTDVSVAEAVSLVMGTADGVEWAALKIAESKPLPSRMGVILRLQPTVTDVERAAAEKAVRALPGTESVTVEGSDAAYERLRKQCRGKGELATLLEPHMARASVRFQFTLKEKAPDLPTLDKLDGVDALQMVPVAML